MIHCFYLHFPSFFTRSLHFPLLLQDGPLEVSHFLDNFTFFISLSKMKTLLITPEGLEKLKAELDHLWRVERPETTQKVTLAASLGDRSEKADYHYNKKRLREIDKRVLYLNKYIEELKVGKYLPH